MTQIFERINHERENEQVQPDMFLESLINKGKNVIKDHIYKLLRDRASFTNSLILFPF